MELPRYRHDSTGWPDPLIPLIQQRPLRFSNSTTSPKILMRQTGLAGHGPTFR